MCSEDSLLFLDVKKAKEGGMLTADVMELLDKLLEEHAEETYKFIMAMCIMEEGEPEPDGIALIIAAFSLISDKRVLDFLLQLGKSGLIATDA